jgi:hypothetical protein
MPRPNDTERYEFSDAEKRDLIKLIEQGKPLPEKYRFLLFEDKREVELVWNGKSREVCTAILPFQTLEHIDEPRKEKAEEGELGLGMGGRQVKGWTNKLVWGDNKLILSSLKAGALRRQIEDAGGLKLIYIDPPFDVGADFSMDIEIGGETFHKEPNLLEQIAYRDTWGRGADSFIAMIYERLILMRDLMHKDGSIYVHCDYRTTLTCVPFSTKFLAVTTFCLNLSGSVVVEAVAQFMNLIDFRPAQTQFCSTRNPRLAFFIRNTTTMIQHILPTSKNTLFTPTKKAVVFVMQICPILLHVPT